MRLRCDLFVHCWSLQSLIIGASGTSPFIPGSGSRGKQWW